MKDKGVGSAEIFGILIWIVIFGTILFAMCSCGKTNNENVESSDSNRFFVIEMFEDEKGDTYPMKIWVDKETRVQYMYNINQGGICVIVDADGKPLLYDGPFD
jgi:hypothetical protein